MIYHQMVLDLYVNYFFRVFPLQVHRMSDHEDEMDDLRHKQTLGQSKISLRYHLHQPVQKFKFTSLS